MKLYSTRGLVCLTLSILATSQSGWAQKPQNWQSMQLPVRHGYYATDGDSCAKVMKDMSGVAYRGRNWEYEGGLGDMVRVVRRSAKEYEITEQIEDEAGAFKRHKDTLRIISPTSFTVTTPTTEGPNVVTYRFCSPHPPKGWDRREFGE